ncbi:GNAT family N-acetyltransferase [Weissella paramesenteroides]|uniref:GNAT family N-acetyltransferase n=1 Tax=Weissella paramesenteroides TaxID=1249 RepID=UPI00388D9C54
MFVYNMDNEVSLSLPRPKIDAEPLFKLVNQSRQQLEPWLPWVSNMKSVADEEKFLIDTMKHFGTGYSLNTIILFQNQPAGMISFNKFQSMDQSTEIGYWLGTKYMGHGIMHRSVSGMCDIGFNDYNVHKIAIKAAVENQRSNDVAKKAGFHFDGSFRDAELLSDGFHDGNVWTLLEDEWKIQNKTLSDHFE